MQNALIFAVSFIGFGILLYAVWTSER